jgi:hypothetical protein
VLRRLKQEDLEFKANLGFGDSVSKTQNSDGSDDNCTNII